MADTTEGDALVKGGGAYVVTGAGSGLNLAITKRLLAHGCRVAAWDLNKGGLEGVSDANLTFDTIDVRDKAGQVAAANKAADWAGGIAGLVAGAGVMTHAPFLEMTEEAFDRTMAINLKGAVLTCQAVIPHMRKAKKGSVVMFASMLARSTGWNAADYIASKAGILGFARSIALELAEEGVRVNTVSPAIVDTPMPRAVYGDSDFAARASETPMKRLATPDDMAAAALFLLGEDASFITAQDIRVSGGARLF